MKTPSDELFQLVQSLKQTEKRYFMLFAKTLGGGKENKSYTELISRLNKQEVFNEEKLKSKFSPTNFKKVKHYATAALLRSLENFHAESSTDVLIHRYFIQLEILHAKKQFKLSRKCLNKLTAIVYERDLLQFMLPIMHWEYKLSIDTGEPSAYLKTLKKYDTSKIANDYRRWMDVRKLLTTFWYLITTFEHFEAKEKKELKHIVRTAEKILSESTAGYTILRESYSVLGLANRFLGNTTESYNWRKKGLQLIEENRTLLNERGAEYIVSIGNLMNTCRELGKEDELLTLFNKANKFMQDLPSNFHDQHLDERYCNLLNSRISFLYTKKKYADVIMLGEELYKKLNKHTSAFQNSIYNVLCQNMIFSSFYIDDFKTANKFYNQWLKEKGVDDIQKKLFGIVLYYQQGDTDLCFYKCKALRYALRGQKQKNVFALVLEKYFTTVLLDITDKKEERKAFDKLHDLVLKDKKLYESMTKANEFNYEEWIKTKK